MNILLNEHQEILGHLIQNHVEFLLIGGYAVIYHGYNRSTGDMDLWLNPTNENRDKIINALTASGFETEDLETLSNVDFTKHFAFSIGIEPQKIDFITYINQVSFDEAYRNKVMYSFENMQIPVINIRELILSKINTGRKKDEADVEELQKRMNINKTRL
ncbi:MAG: nucleotidyltransferase [Saprospiraceae bacterium]|uniref:Nucleotidyltransferase n=1 Tax=Candidatus Opimibacter skivensis TaxID=2982028 RepID=A0A9D7SUR2_9BACT|nr:nucleotidyltransferase [Candidatus Opimibacter skivensis]